MTRIDKDGAKAIIGVFGTLDGAVRFGCEQAATPSSQKGGGASVDFTGWRLDSCAGPTEIAPAEIFDAMERLGI